jgi:hypothetical protein
MSEILVEYLPYGEASPFPDPTQNVWRFETHKDFKEWVQDYVCLHCLVDFLDISGKEPESLSDWLQMGCGCEIGVTDEHNMIKWDDKMEKTEYVQSELDNYKKMMAEG